MNRKESGEYKNKKKSAFKPIMLTSKQIKPIQRSNLSKLKCERKLSYMKSNDVLEENLQERKRRQSYIALSSSANRSEIIKKLTEQYRDSLIKKLQGHHKNPRTSQHNRSIPPSVIKVQFDGEDSRSPSQNRYSHVIDIQGCQPKALQKFLYFTNSKTFDSFVRPDKIKFNNSKHAFPYKSMRKQHNKTHNKEDNLDCFMKTHYLNVKKVNPKHKYSNQIEISTQKMEEITKKVDDYHNNLLKKFDEKYKTAAVMLSKKIAERELIGSPVNSDIPISQQSKIEEDILAKRHSPNKKQYFVFGMGETSSKTNYELLMKNKFEIYKDFLWKINFTNGIYVRIKDEIEVPYKMFVGRGNNSMLIKGIARRRPWWQIVDKISSDTNMVWTQLKVNQYFGFQHHHEEKKKIFYIKNRKIHSSLEGSTQIRKNLLNEEKLSVFELDQIPENDPHQSIMMGSDYDLWIKHYKTHKKYEDRFENYMGKRVKTLVRKKNLFYIADSLRLKVQNHLECNYYLGNKKALFYSMKNYYQLNHKNIFDFLPITFHICKGVDDPEYEKFLKLFYEFDEKKKKKEMLNIWIMKPGEFTNRGKGINVCSSLDDIKIRLKGRQKSKNGKYHTFILQKYIQRPFLYNKRKFDIRHFMLMTCVHGKFKGYWYSEGYIRTSSYEYNIKNCKDLYTHLTNDSIQQNSQDYGKFEKGNKLSYNQFQKYLNQYSRRVKGDEERYDFQKTILPKMKSIAKDTMQASFMLLAPKKQEHNFELFGLDFMLDEDLNVSLIEVNTNPCLQTSCPLLSRVISTLIENVFKICIDPLYPPPYEWPSQKKYQLGENALDDNKFTLIFDESIQGETLKKNYENSQIYKQMGEIEEEEEQYDDEGKQWVQD